MFRKNWNYDPSSQNKQKTIDNMMECLRVLETQVQKGNIRYFGLSNESAWGTAQWLRLSEENSLPRVQTIQNEYSLLCRLYDTDLAELSLNEDVGLLAFSASLLDCSRVSIKITKFQQIHANQFRLSLAVG